MDDSRFLAVIASKLDTLIERSAQPPQRFLSVKSAAEYADLSEDSIRRLLERGDLVGRRPVKGRILIDKQELDRLILGSTRQPVNGRGRQTGKGTQ